jgi:tetratricopeptide (TPR) repeat protein
VEVKLGYLPHPQALKVSVADQGLMVAEAAVVKVLFYFGTLVQKYQENVIIRPEYANMYRMLQAAVELDPYNMDAYHFAEAAFTWELGRIAEVNELLERGARYRTWDASIPFYLGFNHAYFLKDYPKAARYMQQAAEISGNPLYANLAARYFYESEQAALGMTFLDAMIAQTRDRGVRQTFLMRREALLAVTQIETGLELFQARSGRPARSLNELVRSGSLKQVPSDPYGGEFYLDEMGRVRSTSKFSNPKP